MGRALFVRAVLVDMTHQPYLFFVFVFVFGGRGAAGDGRCCQFFLGLTSVLKNL